jgi:acetyl esterase/lipase
MQSKTSPFTDKMKPVDYMDDAALSHEVKSFLQTLDVGASIENLAVEEARQYFSNLQASVKVEMSEVDVVERVITTDDDYTVRLHIVRPVGVKGILPAVLYIPGGGWVLPDFPSHQRLVRDLVLASGCAAVFINYTTAPEAEYPFAVHEIYAIVRWISQNGAQLDVDGERLAIAGNGAGGNLATVTALMAAGLGGPTIRLQILLWPTTDAQSRSGSYQLYGEHRWLTASMMQWLYSQYNPNGEKRAEIYLSPLQASLQQLRGLPPALILVAENDILRDVGEAYGRKLNAAGVTITTIRYNGVIHDFGLLNALALIPQTQLMINQAAGALKKYLKQSH